MVRSKALWAVAVTALSIAFSAGAFSAESAGPSKAAVVPHQVIACYFHRTVRCPTCQKISAYIDESIQSRFASELKDGSVKMVMIDFQDPRNEAYTRAYQIAGPTLVLIDVRDGKAVAWKPAPKVWSLVGQKDQFVAYVEGEVRSYLIASPLATSPPAAAK